MKRLLVIKEHSRRVINHRRKEASVRRKGVNVRRKGVNDHRKGVSDRRKGVNYILVDKNRCRQVKNLFRMDHNHF